MPKKPGRPPGSNLAAARKNKVRIGFYAALPVARAFKALCAERGWSLDVGGEKVLQTGIETIRREREN